MSIFDFDDFHEGNHRLDLLTKLREANPLFKCTLFAVPALGSEPFWASVPYWCELAVHGWLHPDPYESSQWSAERCGEVLDSPVVRSWFVRGFKAPGWQISDGCYEALVERDFWVADQPYNDERRPPELRVHRLDDGDHWHGHIQNDCGNGLEETWSKLVAKVRRATNFQFISEVVSRSAGVGVCLLAVAS